MSKHKPILDQLESWQRGYLPPSAQILMGDAYTVIVEQTEEIIALQDKIKELETVIEKQHKKKK
jgi:hypothetical protein